MITHDVEEGDLAIGRSRQLAKPGYAKRLKKKSKIKIQPAKEMAATE